MEYLAVVVGEVDEIEEMMPDLFNTYVIDGDALNTNMTLYTRFEENGKKSYMLIILGYDSPFLTMLFGK